MWRKPIFIIRKEIWSEAPDQGWWLQFIWQWVITDPIWTTQMYFQTDLSSTNNVKHVWHFELSMCTVPKWVVVSLNHWIIATAETSASLCRVYSEVNGACWVSICSCRINNSYYTCDANLHNLFVFAGPVWDIPRWLHLQSSHRFLH